MNYASCALNRKCLVTGHFCSVANSFVPDEAFVLF